MNDADNDSNRRVIEKASKPSRSILIVDSIESTRLQTKKHLFTSGYKILESSTGVDALKIASEQPIDLILLDVHLPDLSGYEVCARLKKDSQLHRIPVVHTSSISFTRGADQLRGSEGGADAYLHFPLDPLVLLSTVEVCLRIYRREQDLKILAQKLEEEKELRERFVATLSHDLLTPMTAAKLTAQLLGRKNDLPPYVKTMSDRIVASMNRADSMVRDLLDANNIKAGDGVQISRDDCRIDTLLEIVVKDQSLIHGKTFRYNNQAGETTGYWDRNALYRVIENLTSNAIKYGDPDSPISLNLSKTESFLKVSVHNEGPSISVEDQKTLFNAYHRTESAIQGGQKGWGIGLTLVKSIIEAHDGTVQVSSEPLKGTTFSFQIPYDSRQKI